MKIEDIFKNDIYVIKPKNKDIFFGSKKGTIYKREDTYLQLFKEKGQGYINFYFHYDKSDKSFLIISAMLERCLGIYEDDKDMKLSLIPLSPNANCKWIINKKGNSSEFILKSKKLYLTFFNDSFCKLSKRDNSISQIFTVIKINHGYNLHNFALMANNILNSALPPEHIFNEIEININDLKKVFSKKNITRVELTNNVLIIDENAFIDFENIEYVKCNPEYLKFFNNKNLNTIIINEGSEKLDKKILKVVII